MSVVVVETAARAIVSKVVAIGNVIFVQAVALIATWGKDVVAVIIVAVATVVTVTVVIVVTAAVVTVVIVIVIAVVVTVIVRKIM